LFRDYQLGMADKRRCTLVVILVVVVVVF